jgi:hypothetical protein
MKYKSEPGDLLAISGECMADHANLEEFKDQITGEYNHPALKDFVGSPLRTLSGELEIGGGLDDALKRIRVAVVDGLASGFSSVPDSVTVEVATHLKRRRLTLATSTRYQEDAFIRFAEGFQFKHLTSVPSPKNSNYRLLVFLRV